MIGLSAMRSERTRSEDAMRPPRLRPPGETDRLTQWLVAQLIHVQHRPHPSPRSISHMLKMQSGRAVR